MKVVQVISLILFTGFLLSSCHSDRNSDDGLISSDLVTNPNSATGGDPGLLPVITFEKPEHDFGKVIQGETVSYNFTFTNTGKSDLIIVNASTSCGCTVPSYPKTAVRPGETGVVKVSFDSRGRKGLQAKSVLIVANTQPNVTKIIIRAQIVSPGSD